MRLLGILMLLATFKPAATQPGLLNKITLDEAVSMAIRNHSALAAIGKRELMAEVESTYLEYVYLVNRYNLLQKQAYLTSDLERIANLRYRTGDIDLAEKSEMMSGIDELRTTLSMLDDELAITANNLKILLLTRENLVPADSVLTMYALQKREEQSHHADSLTQLVFEKKRENLEYELNSYFKKIRYYNQTALVHADILLESGLRKFEKEEFSYFEYSQNVNRAFSIRAEYLQTLNEYNQTAIKLESYAY